MSAQPIGHNGKNESECSLSLSFLSLIFLNGSVAFLYVKRCANVIPPWHFLCCGFFLCFDGMEEEYCLMSTLGNVQ